MTDNEYTRALDLDELERLVNAATQNECYPDPMESHHRKMREAIPALISEIREQRRVMKEMYSALSEARTEVKALADNIAVNKGDKYINQTSFNILKQTDIAVFAYQNHMKGKSE